MKPQARYDGLRWYALRVKSTHELRIAGLLRDLGYHASVPVRQVYRKRSRYQRNLRQHAKVRRMFPVMYGYILIGFKIGQPINWYQLLSQTFVSGVVCADGVERGPTCLSAGQVRDLLQRETDGMFVDQELFARMQTHGEYLPGDSVEVYCGGFDGLQATVVDVPEGGNYVVLSVEFLGATRQIKAPVDQCVKAA